MTTRNDHWNAIFSAREGAILHEITQDDISRILELCLKYEDLPMDFADATLVVAAERTGMRTIISIDSDNEVMPAKAGIQNNPPGVFEKLRIDQLSRNSMAHRFIHRQNGCMENGCQGTWFP